MTYPVAPDGTPGAPSVHPSIGKTPFGFTFTDDGTLLVSEAFGGAEKASAVSSYAVGNRGALTPISRSIPTQQTAACWMAAWGDYAWAANAGSDTVSGYRVAQNGGLTLLDADGASGHTGAGPLDDAVTPDGKFLYVLNGKGDSISGFAIGARATLTKLTDMPSLPATAFGLVVR